MNRVTQDEARQRSEEKGIPTGKAMDELKQERASGDQLVVSFVGGSAGCFIAEGSSRAEVAGKLRMLASIVESNPMPGPDTPTLDEYLEREKS